MAGTPQWDGQTDGRLGAGEATVPCAQNLRGRGNERGLAQPSCRTRPRGIGEGKRGLSFQTLPHGLEKNGLSSVCCIAQGIARGGEGLAKWGQRRNDFGARVGRDAQKGNVDVHHYCFLLGQRVGEGSRRMLEVPRMGALGLAPPQPRCRWEPLQPPLLWLWESLRQKQEEKQLEGGCSSEPFPSNRENSNGTQSGRGREWQVEGGSGALLKTSDPRLMVRMRMFLQHPLHPAS